MNERLKIAFVINSLKNRNGASVFLISLLTSLSRYKNIDFILITLYDSIDESFLGPINQNNINMLQCHKKNKFDLRSARLFRKFINQFSPDIINIHLPVILTYFLAFGFRKKTWRIVKTYHSIPGRDLNRLNICFEKKYVSKGMLDFIAISKTIGDMSKNLYPSADVEIINNGILLPEEITPNNKKKFDFVIVGSLEDVKNHMLLFRAFQRVLLFKQDSTLAVVGDGSKKEEYLNYVRSLNLDKNIIFLGQINNVGAVLQQSTIFVLSSLREGNPISMLEALAYGLPVIVPNVGGIPDIVQNGINGYLYSVNNEDELTKKMTDLINNLKLQSNMSKHNVMHARDFSIKKTSDDYVSYFSKILSREKKR